MANQNPFDPQQLMRNLDPMKLLEEFNKQLSQYRLPNVDTSQFMDSQRKNLEALTEANRLLMSSTQALMQRQAELLTQANRETVNALQALSGAKPDELPQKQAELVSQAHGRAVAALHEVTEMINKAHQEALQVLDKRWRENIEEMKRLSGQSTG